MTSVWTWRVFVELQTPSLQDTQDLDRLRLAMQAHDDVVTAAPTIGSLGKRYSVVATIVIQAADSATAADRAQAILRESSAAAGLAIGKTITSYAEPADQ